MTAKDHTVSGETFTILQCFDCGFLLTSPRPDLSDLGKYYQSEEYISHSDTSKGIVSKVYKLARFFTLSRKYKLVRPFCIGKPLLDVGAGTGAFLNHCKLKGIDVSGVEPDPGARAFALKNYDLPFYEEEALDRFEPRTFGAITMWHVLEHVPNLEQRLCQLHRILDDDGRIFIAVPNADAYDAKIYKEYWAAYDVPRHLWHFSPVTMNELITKNGFELQKTLPMKLDAFYISLLSERYKTGKTRFINALMNGLISNKNANKFGWSSQIYVLRKKG